MPRQSRQVSTPAAPVISRLAMTSMTALTRGPARDRKRSNVTWPRWYWQSPMKANTAKAVPASTSSKRSEEHTSEIQSLMRISHAVLCLQKQHNINTLQLKEHKTINHINQHII